jgi:mRNA-degrading endonuclease toxin of MazEF toxin-antitoxin module
MMSRRCATALIVSNDIANEHGAVVTVVPITRTIPKKPYPQNVALPAGVLREPGTIYCGQPLTVSKERLGDYLGSLPTELIPSVDDALRHHLGLF